jgi:hypothetical protein
MPELPSLIYTHEKCAMAAKEIAARPIGVM